MPIPQVQSYVRNGLGVLVLNRLVGAQQRMAFASTVLPHAHGAYIVRRPKALNSLTLGMVQRITDLLSRWTLPGSGVGAVLIKSVSSKVCMETQHEHH
jgi:enoyl-CoA hydratase/carnithine racemase